eukprot:m.458641 g.458641  ORF g.458641 m.458641 type:complete len:788 (-) comp21555_c0_seq1:63-2426(-)
MSTTTTTSSLCNPNPCRNGGICHVLILESEYELYGESSDSGSGESATLRLTELGELDSESGSGLDRGQPVLHVECTCAVGFVGTRCELESSSPTTLPTSAPSKAPTSLNPTMIPTTAPTSSSPTANPFLSSSFPSTTPTTIPTAAPTTIPTTVPTTLPSSIPTSDPTVYPTSVPTQSQTIEPTAAPSDVPTVPTTTAPSEMPTSTPSMTLTIAPTANPSLSPTTHPTTTPSAAPTIFPTMAPSAAPTSTPTPLYRLTFYLALSCDEADLDVVENQTNVIMLGFGIPENDLLQTSAECGSVVVNTDFGSAESLELAKSRFHEITIRNGLAEFPALALPDSGTRFDVRVVSDVRYTQSNANDVNSALRAAVRVIVPNATILSLESEETSDLTQWTPFVLRFERLQDAATFATALEDSPRTIAVQGQTYTLAIEVVSTLPPEFEVDRGSGNDKSSGWDSHGRWIVLVLALMVVVLVVAAAIWQHRKKNGKHDIEQVVGVGEHRRVTRTYSLSELSVVSDTSQPNSPWKPNFHGTHNRWARPTDNEAAKSAAAALAEEAAAEAVSRRSFYVAPTSERSSSRTSTFETALHELLDIAQENRADWPSEKEAKTDGSPKSATKLMLMPSIEIDEDESSPSKESLNTSVTMSTASTLHASPAASDVFSDSSPPHRGAHLNGSSGSGLSLLQASTPQQRPTLDSSLRSSPFYGSGASSPASGIVSIESSPAHTILLPGATEELSTDGNTVITSKDRDNRAVRRQLEEEFVDNVDDRYRQSVILEQLDDLQTRASDL